MSCSEHNNRFSLSKRICYTALFAAIVCVTTLLTFPLPIGYFNLGDTFILLSAWLLPSVLGGVAAGIGAALGDLIMGYAIYIPATLVIKFTVAIAAKYLYRLFKKWIKRNSLDFLPRFLSALIAEFVMILGYFFFESVCLGYGLGATASIFGNGLQATSAIIGGTLFISTLSPSKFIQKHFDL